jgi:hypothetical protein
MCQKGRECRSPDPLISHQPPSWPSFPHRSLYIPNIFLVRKKRLPGGENVRNELGGVWMMN